MRRQIRKRKCKHCNDYFLPDHRNRKRQKFCFKPSCRKVSKADSQRRWLQKPENRDYFKGADHVERVRRWRKSHPDYWRKKPESKTALQDSLPAGSIEESEVKESLTKDALQDVLSAQDTIFVGLIAQLTGSQLQDDIAATARRLRQLGHDILNHRFSTKGGSNDCKTPPTSGATPKTSGGIQLAGSPSGP